MKNSLMTANQDQGGNDENTRSSQEPGSFFHVMRKRIKKRSDQECREKAQGVANPFEQDRTQSGGSGDVEFLARDMGPDYFSHAQRKNVVDKKTDDHGPKQSSRRDHANRPQENGPALGA